MEKSNKTYSKKAKWIEIKIEHFSNFVVKGNEERERKKKKKNRVRWVFFTAILIIFLLSLFDFSHLFAPKLG